MAVLAVVGLAAAGAAHDRTDDSAGRSGLPLIGLTLSGNDIAHFERIYDRLRGSNPDSPFYRENNRWRRAQLRYDGTVYTVRVKIRSEAYLAIIGFALCKRAAMAAVRTVTRSSVTATGSSR